MQTIQGIKDRLLTRPFNAFRLVTSNGRSYDVTDPDQMLTLGKEITIGQEPDEDGFYTSSKLLGIDQVVSLEPIGEAPKPPKEPGFEGDPFKRPGED